MNIEDLKKVLAYDADSGVIYWVVGNSRRKAGDVAGTTAKSGYMYISYKYKMYLAHRVAWALFYGEYPEFPIDHINRDKKDNRIENLRLCKERQKDNAQNSNLRLDNTSGHTGVHFFKRTGKFQAYINTAGKRKNLGYYSTAEEAYTAYIEAKKLYHTFNPEVQHGE